MDSLRGKRYDLKTDRWPGRSSSTRFMMMAASCGASWKVREMGHRRMRSYATMQVTEDVHTASSFAASGHTLTVVLNLATGRMFGFASNNTDWHPLTGTFEVVQ